ncbi:MAG: acyl carrier protein [Clostridiales bacterium]|nr:acyl carrier protein [Clostridiales bacterium]MBR2821573.1 acyl carrier protein [Clostridiales bacterium]
MISELYSIICDTYKTMNRTFDVPLESITLDSDLKEIGIDSLSFVVILMNIESRMNISLPMDGNFTLKTVGDVVNMIESSK